MSFIIAYRSSYLDASPQIARLERFTTGGGSEWQLAGAVTGDPAYAWRLAASTDAVIASPIANQPVVRYGAAGGAVEWSWVPDDPSFSGWDAQPDGAGGAWVLRPANDSLHHIDATGTEVTEYRPRDDASWPAGVGNAPVSLALAQDASVAYLLTSHGDVVGVNLSTGAVLWSVRPEATSDQTPSTQAERFTIRRIPGLHSLVLNVASEIVGSYRTGMLVRLDFAGDDPAVSPSVAWTEDWTDRGLEFNRYITAICPTANGIYVGGYASTRSGGGNRHLLARYNLDGTLAWRQTDAGYTADTYVEWRDTIAYEGGYVVAGSGSNSVDFPDDWWGFQRYAATTGARAAAGVFPLQAYDASAVVAMPSTDGVAVVAPFESYDSPQYSVGEGVHALTQAGAYEAGFPLSPPPIAPNTELYPRDAAISPDHIYIGDLYGLYQYDHAGSLVNSVLAGGFAHAVVCYRGGKLVSANTGSAGYLREINPATLADVWTLALTSTEDLADFDLDSNGDIFTAAHTFADPYYIRKRSGVDGSEIVSGGWPYLWGSTSGFPPTHIAVGPNDEVAVSGKTSDGLGTIRLLNPDGSLRWSTEFDLEGFNISSGVVVDTNGDVLVADYANVRKFAAADGATVWTVEHMNRTPGEIDGIENGAPGADGSSYWLAQRTSGSDVGWEIAKLTSAGAVEWETIIIPLQNPAPLNMYSYNIASPTPYAAPVDTLAPTSSPTDVRVYSNVSRTVGSLLTATNAPAFEDSVRMGFFEAHDLTRGELVPFLEPLTPDVTLLRFYPFPIEGHERLNEFAGGTKLGRMMDAYPRQYVVSAANTPLGSVGYFTPAALLGTLFNEWENEFSWFTYKPVPDLRYRRVDDNYDGERGLVHFEGIVLKQDETGRLSMRQILDRFLALFPGTGIMQDADGDIVLRPTYGPDAPTTPIRTLASSDIFAQSTGDPDPRGVANRARVRTRGGSYQDGVALMTNIYYPLVDSTDAGEEALTFLGDQGQIPVAERVPTYRYRPWDVGLVAGDDVSFDYSLSLYAVTWDGDPTVPASVPVGYTLEKVESGSVNNLPWGQYHDLYIQDPYDEGIFGGGWDVRATIRVRVQEVDGIAVTASGSWTGGPAVQASGTWVHFIAIADIYNIIGRGFTENATTVVGEFGYAGDTLIDGAGDDVLAASVAMWGEREVEINAEAFPLEPSEANIMAQAIVQHLINPKLVRTIEQSWSSLYKVAPDDEGLLIALPSAEVGFLEARHFSDDYRNVQRPSLSSTIKVAVTEVAYAVEGMLLWDDGTFARFDSGEQIEAG